MKNKLPESWGCSYKIGESFYNSLALYYCKKNFTHDNYRDLSNSFLESAIKFMISAEGFYSEAKQETVAENIVFFLSKLLDHLFVETDFIIQDWNRIYDFFTEPRNFADYKHNSLGKLYDSKNYVTHLDDVKNTLDSFSFEYFNVEGFYEILYTSIYLHDIIEDTDETVKSLSDLFCTYSVMAAYHCTDENGINRKERKFNTNLKLKKLSVNKIDEYIALLVKTADRYSNMLYSFKNNDSLFKMYLSEYDDFRDAVYREGLLEDLWAILDKMASK